MNDHYQKYKPYYQGKSKMQNEIKKYITAFQRTMPVDELLQEVGYYESRN